MTGRERLQQLMNHQPADRLSWTILVDDLSLKGFPAEWQGNGGLDFYRRLGSDILLLDGWGTPHQLRSPELRWGDGVVSDWRSDGEDAIQKWRTPGGTLTAVYRRGHPLKYPVDSLQALRCYHAMWEGARYLACDDSAAFRAIEQLIGEDGISTRFWGPSTIPLLLETVMGTEQFYYLLADYPEEMDSLIALIHQRELAAFHALAAGPWQVITLCENTSSFYIGPEIYRRYNMPHVRDFVDIAHAAGKTAIIHMCGHVHDLLQDIKQTGLDGIHALTPPPLGDTPWETALEVLGDDLIIIGCLPANLYLTLPEDELFAALDHLITPRVAASPFTFCAFADGISVPLERFQMVQRAVERWNSRRG